MPAVTFFERLSITIKKVRQLSGWIQFYFNVAIISLNNDFFLYPNH